MTVQIDEFLGMDKLCEGIAGCKYIGDVAERQCIGVILRESQLYIVVLDISCCVVDIHTAHFRPAQFDDTLLCSIAGYSELPFYKINQFSVIVPIRLAGKSLKEVQDDLRRLFLRHLNKARDRICLRFHPFQATALCLGVEVVIELRHLPADHFPIIALQLIEQVVKISVNALMNNSVLSFFLLQRLIHKDRRTANFLHRDLQISSELCSQNPSLKG